MRRHAFTLVEILVTVAVLAVVMTLLTVPLMSSLGYVKKAKAISEAKTAALKAIDNIKSDIEEASVIFDFPVTGEGITYLKDTTDPTSGVVTGQTMHRYLRILDFPWYWGGQTPPAKWTLLQPDYVDGTLPRYKDRYAPFHLSEKSGTEPRNPFIIAQYNLPTSFDWSANSAEVWNYSAPLDTANYVALANGMKNRTVIERMYRNDLQAITPYGAMWDIPAFVANPVRINNETLTMDKDSTGEVKPGVLFSRNGLWAARNQLLDEWAASAWSGWYTIDKPSFMKLYGVNSADTDKMIAKDYTAPFFSIMKSITPFYPINTNPFGYKIKIYDKNGMLCYGTAIDTAKTYSIVLERHFMDYPPMERDDFNIKLSTWATGYPIWTKDDIDAQRLAGKVVFNQPMAPTKIDMSTGFLPVPTGWDDNGTYLATPPYKIVVWDGANAASKETFVYVKNPVTLGKDEYTLTATAADKYKKNSRAITFGKKRDGSTLSGNVEIWYPEPKAGKAIQPLYYICDLQPDDVATASYSTKGQIDVTLTLARQDTAARSPEQSRQDYSVAIRLEAKNAVRRALESR
ncbi:MAG: prepilin-type N-terminal cleavage/methylation domain-containing protein [bacterium]